MLVYGTIMKPILKLFKIPLEKIQPHKFDCDLLIRATKESNSFAEALTGKSGTIT